MDLKSLTPESLSVIPDEELVSIHDHLHRVFRVSGEKGLIASAHDMFAEEIASRNLSHSTPLVYHPHHTGLYLKHPHSRLIYDGKKSLIVQPAIVPIEGSHILVSKENGTGLAYGLVTIGEPDTIDRKGFDSQFNLHRVTTKERKKWWSESKKFYLYPITSFTPYAQPLSVEVPAGVQMVMQDVKFTDTSNDISNDTPIDSKVNIHTDSNTGSNAGVSDDLDTDSDVKVDNSEDKPMPWKASDAQSHTKIANTPAKQKRWAAVANSALASCKGDRKKCEASAIRQANSVIGKASKEVNSVDSKSMSFTDRIDMVQSQWELEFLSEDTGDEEDAPSSWLEDIYDDRIIYRADNSIFAQPYTLSEDQSVVFYEPYTIGGESALDAEGVQSKEKSESQTEVIPEVEVSETQDALNIDDKEAEIIQAVKATIESDVDLADSDSKAGRRIRKSMLTRLEDAFSTLKEIIGWAKEPDVKLPMVFKSTDGKKSYFIIWPTNSYFDREEEAFRAKALNSFVDRMDSHAVKSVAQFWHTPGTTFGDVTWQDVIEDRFLAQVGEFRDTPVGNAFKEFFTRYPNGHPTIAPEGWGASHGFRYNPADRPSGVYKWLHTNESTVLPLRYAANLLNPSPIALGGKEMNDKRRDALREISDEVGVDLVQYVEATAKAARELADEKVEHKMIKEDVKTETEDVSVDTDVHAEVDAKESEVPDEKESEVATSATEVQDTDKSTDTDVAADAKEGADADAIVDAIVKQLGLKELSGMIQAQTESLNSLQLRMDKIESSDESKIAEKAKSEVPRYSGFAWLQASKSDTTVLTEAEKEEFKGKVPNTGNAAINTLVAGL